VHHEYFSLISEQIECFTSALAITHALYETIPSPPQGKNKAAPGQERERESVCLACILPEKLSPEVG